MPTPNVRVTLVGASVLRESELPGFEAVTDFASQNYNLAIATLKASVISAPDLAHRVHITTLDFCISWDRKTLRDQEARRIADTAPDIVGLSCYCWSVDTLLDVARALRILAPRAFILLGGPSAGPVALDLLAEHPFVDAVAMGEGETTFLSLLRCRLDQRDLDDVPGLAYRDASGAPRTSSAPDVPLDLASLPSPYRAGVLAPPRSMLLETSRGCRFRCRFCSWMGGGRQLRYVPIESIEADVAWALEYGVRDIKIADTAINFHTDRLQQLTDAVRRVDPTGKLRFTYFLKPELLDQRQADALRGIPTDEIIIGVESLTPAARRAVGKPPFDPDAFERTLAMLRDIGPVTVSLILGLPGDSEAGLCHTIDWLTSFDDTHPGWLHVICLFWLAVLPGSSLHARRHDHGFRIAAGQTPYALESRHFDPDQLLAMARSSIERHYRHPKLRVEYFHKEYLMQDAPAVDRHAAVERVRADHRPRIVLAAILPRNEPFGMRPYDLGIAWMKAYAEASPELRRTWDIQLVHVDSSSPDPLAQAIDPACRALVVSGHDGTVPPRWLAEVRAKAPGMLLLARHHDSLPAARDLISALPGLDAVIVGEPERAFRQMLEAQLRFEAVPGIVYRDGDRVHDTGPPLLIERLDDIPSPLQWGFVQRAGDTIAMQWSRPPSPSSPGMVRAFSGKRLYADLRWAIEQRHTHVVWLDPSIPTEDRVLADFVGAIRKADPEAKIAHTYTLSPASLTPAAVDRLAQVRTREIRIAQNEPVPGTAQLFDELRRRTGAIQTPPPSTPSATRLHTILHPWRVGATIEGWTLEAVAPAEQGAIEIRFGWKGQGSARVTLTRSGGAAARTWHASIESTDSTPPHARQRLMEMISKLLTRSRR
jgi:radical SAM superfamily enzyme YgiQ (UPF0313 family)